MKNSGIYFIVDENNSHCGITDRLKAAVGLCFVAKQNGMDFKFIHRAGFDLRDFLVPNKINWSAELSDITHFPWRKKNIIYHPPFNNFPVFNDDIYIRFPKAPNFHAKSLILHPSLPPSVEVGCPSVPLAV